MPSRFDLFRHFPFVLLSSPFSYCPLPHAFTETALLVHRKIVGLENQSEDTFSFGQQLLISYLYFVCNSICLTIHQLWLHFKYFKLKDAIFENPHNQWQKNLLVVRRILKTERCSWLSFLSSYPPPLRPFHQMKIFWDSICIVENDFKKSNLLIF